MTKTASNQSIQLGEFTLDEINLMLGGLGQLPYVQVAELVGKIQSIVIPQLKNTNVDSNKSD
jgi:hypothetical protein